VRGLVEEVAERERVFVVGAGGVGKTTLSAALAVETALASPARVLVVTVDPAKRLASTLGVDLSSNEPHEVDLSGLDARGSLAAAAVDMKQAWDELVREFAPSGEVAERILANRIYENLSSKFIGSYDYAAVQVLANLTASGDFDLVIVDTPPSRNALDFFDAPRRLEEFFTSPLLPLLTLPRRSRLLETATRPFYLVADLILGADFLSDITDFFANFSLLQDGLRGRASDFAELLASPATGFVAVSLPFGPSVDEARGLVAALTERRLGLMALVVNRALPSSLFTPEAETARRWLEEHGAEALDDLARDPLAQAAGHRVVSELAYVHRQLAGARALELAETEGVQGVFEVPLVDLPLDSLAALAALVRSMSPLSS